MKLYKSDNAQRGKGINKFILKCDENNQKWFDLLNILYKSDNDNAVIIKGLYDIKKDIVLKIGIQESINKEFEIAEQLKELPNFIKYYCKFLCNDEMQQMISSEDISTYNLCNNGNNNIGILTMNYYSLGSIGKYKWNTNNLNVLKNVLNQTIFTILNAFHVLGFIHGDLHAYNVLLKEKTKSEMNYFYKKILIDTYEIRITDFEKSRINKNFEFKFVLDNIEKLFDSIKNNDNYDVKLSYYNDKLRKMKNKIIFENITSYTLTKIHYEQLEEIVDTFYIEYIR